MIPISDDNSGRRITPFVSYGLIGVNILVFIYQLTLPNTPADPALRDFIYRWGAIPDEIVSGTRLETLITAQFLHGSWLHIGANMLFLWVFGDNIEDIMGHVKFLIFYLLTGILAGLAQVAVHPGSEVPLIGASGAIAGVLGAYLVMFPHGKVRALVLIRIIPLFFLVPAWLMLGLWFLLQLVSGAAMLGMDEEFTGGVAFFAHIGGFVAGVVLVWAFRDEAAHRRQLAARRGKRAFQRTGWMGY